MQRGRLIHNIFHKKTVYLLLILYLSWFIGLQILKYPLNPLFIAVPLVLFIVFYPVKGLWIIIAANSIFSSYFTFMHFRVWKAWIYLNDILLICIFIGILLSIFFKITEKKQISFNWGALEYAILFYVVVNFFNVVLIGGRSDLTGAMSDSHNVFFFVAYFIVIYLIRDISDLRHIIWIWLIGSIIISLLGFSRLYTGIGTMFITEDIQRYVAGSSGLFLSFSVVFCILLLILNRYRKTIIFFITNIFLFSILITFNRAAWLALFTGVLTLFIFLSKKQKVRFFNFTVFFLIVAIFFTSILLVTPLREPISSGLENRIEDFFSRDVKTTTNYRLDMWKEAIEEIKKHPFIGHGYGAELTWYYLEESTEFTEAIHNSYLELVLRTGIIGLFSLLMVFSVFIIKTVKSIRTLEENSTQRAYLIGILSSFMSLIIFAIFGPVFKAQYTSIFIWILMGLGMSIIKSINQSWFAPKLS